MLQISLAAARVNAEMTQEQVAEKMKVDRSTVRRWEKGDKIPGYDESKKLSELYNMPLDYIFLERNLAFSENWTRGIKEEEEQQR